MASNGERHRTWLARAQQTFVATGAPVFGSALLTNVRRQALEDTLGRFANQAEPLAERFLWDPEAARPELQALADRALTQMRAAVTLRAGERGLARAAAARMDSWWRATEGQEHIDDERLAAHVRVRILSHLDRMNAFFDSYRAFFRNLLPLCRSDGPTTVLDLAAGHGGFALAAAELAAQSGRQLAITASDIKPEYVDLARASAELRGLSNVTFAVQNALDLTTIAPGRYDVITCTQSLHHFSAGQVAVMFAEACRVAGRGVLFIDGARGALNAAGVAGLSLLLFRDRELSHDALVSFRRFFVPEELELLARIGPWGSTARAFWSPPGLCVLAADKPARAAS